MFLLLLLLLSVSLTPVHPRHGDDPDEAEAGSGCEDAANYFDSIGVDDEDYVSEEEGSTDQFESLIRGPPVFTDSEEDQVSDGTSPALLSDKVREEGERQVLDRTRPSPPQSSGRIIPESLVIKNRTHAKLNGNLIITNSGDQEEPQLFFEEEQKHSQEEPEVKKILIESLGSKGSKMSISVLSIIIIMLL